MSNDYIKSNKHVLLITYNLDKEKSEDHRNGFHETIKNYEHLIVHDSAYAIFTEDSVLEIEEYLKLYVNDKDLVLIIKLSNPYRGWLSSEQRVWLGRRL